MVLLALVAYLCAGTVQLQLPGLNYDEALDAVPAMDVVLHQPVEARATVEIAGQQWPLMIMPYIGPTTSLLLIPAFRLAGVGVVSLRLTTILLGALTLLMAWGFLREFLDERAASIAVLLLALNASYVFWSRMGAFVAQPMLPIFIGALWCFFRWYRSGKPAYLVAASFLMGFGLSTKLLFLWAWAGLAACWLLLSPWLDRGRGWRRWLWPLRRLSARSLALVGLACVAGACIVIWYNLQGLGSFRFFMAQIWSSGEAAGSNVLQNVLGVGFSDLRGLMNGSWFLGAIGPASLNTVALPAFVIALLVIVVLAATRRLKYSPRRLVFLLVLMICFVVSGAASSISHGANHLTLIWPIPQALLGVALVGIVDALASASPRAYRLGLTATGLAAICLVGSEARTTYSFHQALARSGGQGHYSDAIYALANDVEQAGAPGAVVFDWGFLRNLQIITANRVPLQEAVTYTSPPAPEFEEIVQKLMAQPRGLYVFHSPRYTAFPGHWEVFERVAYRNRLLPVLWKTYRERNGEPVYLAYKLVPAPRLLALPIGVRWLDVQAGDGIALLGSSVPDGTLKPGGVLQATLYWQAAWLQQTSYKIFAHLVDANGKQWAGHDAVPVDWTYPTDEWQVGEIVAHRIWLSVPADAPLGTYRLFAGMYDPATGQRAPLEKNGARLQGDTVEVAALELAR